MAAAQGVWLNRDKSHDQDRRIRSKTHLSSLSDKVTQGEDVLVTRRGVPVARLVPARQAQRAKTESAINELRALRASMKLRGLDWKELRDEGRR